MGASNVAVSGTVAAEGTGAAATMGGTFRIRATASSGSVHESEADERERFTLTLPPNNSYVLGFAHRDMMNEAMHFAGYMVFGCSAGESDHFSVSGREPADTTPPPDAHMPPGA